MGSRPAWGWRLGSSMTGPLPSHTGPWGQLEAGGPDTHSPTSTQFWGRGCQERPPAGGVAGARALPSRPPLTRIPGACSNLLACLLSAGQGPGRWLCLGGCLAGPLVWLWKKVQWQVCSFHRLLISIYVTEWLTAASQGCALLLYLPHRSGGRGCPAQLEQIQAWPPHRKHRLTHSAKIVFSWQGRKETTAARKKPPVLGPGSVQILTHKQ